jgi:hypothetical protein
MQNAQVMEIALSHNIEHALHIILQVLQETTNKISAEKSVYI